MSKPRIVTSFSLEPELYTTLKEVLRREGKSLSEFVREAAEAYIKAHGTGNPAVPLSKWLENPEYIACPSILEAKNFNWNQFDEKDLGKFQLIMAQEGERIRSIRRKKQNG